jgi:hypothetical protein
VDRASAATSCAQRVITAWSAGKLDATYPPACYRAALDRLPEDVALYSSAQDDINRELLAAISRQRKPPSGPAGGLATVEPWHAFAAAGGAVLVAVSLGYGAMRVVRWRQASAQRSWPRHRPPTYR